jgi:hypothetical protein
MDLLFGSFDFLRTAMMRELSDENKSLAENGLPASTDPRDRENFGGPL